MEDSHAECYYGCKVKGNSQNVANPGEEGSCDGVDEEAGEKDEIVEFSLQTSSYTSH